MKKRFGSSWTKPLIINVSYFIVITVTDVADISYAR